MEPQLESSPAVQCCRGNYLVVTAGHGQWVGAGTDRRPSAGDPIALDLGWESRKRGQKRGGGGRLL